MAPVQLYVYDLSQGMAKIMAPQLLGLELNGIWHTGLVVYGKEYFFGGGGFISDPSTPGVNFVGADSSSGIRYCDPGTLSLGPPLQILDLGVTQVTEHLLGEYLTELGSSTFRADAYSLFEHNCNHFSNALSEFLTGNKIPEHILNLPQAVLDTPLGGIVRSMFGEQGL